MAIPGIIRMCCYRPIQAALQSSTIYRVRLCFLLDVSLFTVTRGLTTKTNILFGIQKTIGTFRGKTNSTSFYLGNILQDIPGRLKFYWTPRRDETTKENTPNTEIYFPKPTYFPVRDNSCSGTGWGVSAIFQAKARTELRKASGTTWSGLCSLHPHSLLWKPWWCLSAQTEHRALGRAQPERRGCSVLNSHTCEPRLPGRS